MILFSKQIISLFIYDPEIIHIGSFTFIVLNIFFPFYGIQIVSRVFFQIIGKTIPAALLSLAREGLFLIPAAFILPYILGVNGVIFSQTIAELLSSILAISFFLFQLFKIKNAQKLMRE